MGFDSGSVAVARWSGEARMVGDKEPESLVWTPYPPQTDTYESVYCQGQTWRHASFALLLMTFYPENKHTTHTVEMKMTW